MSMLIYFSYTFSSCKTLYSLFIDNFDKLVSSQTLDNFKLLMKLIIKLAPEHFPLRSFQVYACVCVARIWHAYKYRIAIRHISTYVNLGVNPIPIAQSQLKSASRNFKLIEGRKLKYNVLVGCCASQSSNSHSPFTQSLNSLSLLPAPNFVSPCVQQQFKNTWQTQWKLQQTNDNRLKCPQQQQQQQQLRQQSVPFELLFRDVDVLNTFNVS